MTTLQAVCLQMQVNEPHNHHGYQEEEFDRMYPNYDDISVTLKNGEIIKAINPAGYSNIFSGLFELPVIPEEVKSINIKEHIIEIK